MNWHLYRKDDPNTWPEIDCPMLTCRYFSDMFYELKIMYWDQNNNSLYYIENMERRDCYEDELYYQYIGYIPDGYKVIKTTLCGVYPEKLCEYVDDGYCFDCPREIHCKHMHEVNEYSLNDNKRIWKEFKE